MLFSSLFALSSLTLVLGQVPYDPSPFDIIGTITPSGMTLDQTAAGDPLAGGTMTLDGFLITVPRNLLVTLPSITVAWSELFTAPGGLADLPGSVTWEAHVQGNRVNGKNIAGLIYISQKTAQSLSGFITSIDISTGHFKLGASNADCVINDPVGRYGLIHDQHPLWTSDPDNPSIHAVNGFPLCIPRGTVDSLCPSKNRPLVNNIPATTFTFKDPATITATDPDPNQMVPLVVGDYITVSGTEIDGTLWVNNLVANLGIFTAPGTKPAYVTCEEAIFGLVTPSTNAGIAEAGETRAVAWTTDVGGALLDWFAIDVDQCTGEAVERSLHVSMQPNSGVAPLGRAVFRTPGKADLTPATRSVGFRMTSGTSVGASNLTAGQFIQPVFDYTFPELLTAGNQEIPLELETIPYLAQGSGPYIPGLFNKSPPSPAVTVGQLSPWPGATAPSLLPCPVHTTTSSSTTSSTTPTSTAPPPVDTIVITSAVGSNKKGSTTVTVTATTSSKDPNILLSLSATGQNPISLTPMTLVSPGSWSLVVSVKNKPATVTVTSNFGGSATANVA